MADTDPVGRLRLAEAIWGWKPHPTQRQWLIDDSDVKVAACGRRWGKTEAQAVDAATYALFNPGTHQIIVAPTYDQAKLIAGGVERLLLSVGPVRRLTQVRKTPYPVIQVASGRISARSADDDGRGLRGHRAERVMVDEAAFVRDVVITEVIQPMLADCAGQLILISTPYGRNHFHRTWTLGQQDDRRVRSFRFASHDNPHINRAYIEQQRREMPDRSFRAEYLAEFVEDAACVFPWADLTACRELSAEHAETEPGYVVAGIDWARYSDYTVCIALDVGSRPWRITGIDRYQGLSWQATVQRAADFLERHGAAAALCDATSTGDPALEQLERSLAGEGRTDIEVSGLVFTSTSKRDIIDNLCIRLAHRDIALPSDDLPNARTLRLEMEVFTYELNPSGQAVYSAPPGAHDDCVIALALAAWNARNAPQTHIYASSSLPGRRIPVS